jgi:hypothetical protein
LLDIAVVASDVAKWRSAWWRLGCGGLDLTLILVLDFVLGYFCDIVLLDSCLHAGDVSRIFARQFFV